MPIVPILIVVLLLAGVVALALSRTTWRWYNITLVALIMLMSIVWFYLAARTLQTYQAWQKEIAVYQQRLAQVEGENKSLREGGQDGEVVRPSLAQLKLDLEKILLNRGRVWYQVTRKSANPVTGIVTVVVDQPNPHGIEPNTVLFAFDGADADKGGQLVGEFDVTNVNGAELQLTPVLPLPPNELQRVVQGRPGLMVLYEVMPTDSRDLFAELDEATRAAVLGRLPPETQAEYAKDNKPPAADEPDTQRVWQRVRALKDFEVAAGEAENREAQQVTTGTELVVDPKSAEERIASGDVEAVESDGKVYARRTRDYARLYRDLNLQIGELLRVTADVNGQLAVVGDAQKKLNDDVGYRQREIEALNRDLARFRQERDMIAAHVAALDQRVDELRTELRSVYQNNRSLEAELTSIVREAAEAIDRRAPPVPASGNGLTVR